VAGLFSFQLRFVTTASDVVQLHLSYNRGFMRADSHRPKLAGTIIVVLAIAWTLLPAQQSPETPVDLVRRTMQNEVAASSATAKVMFMDRKETPRGSQTKLMVETREGMAGMTIAFNDQPLTPEQRQAEQAHLAGLVHDPDQLKKKQKTEKEDAERIARIMKALPDAFLYEPDGSEVGNQETGKAGAELIRLKFHPNPNYSPPSHVELVLTGMQGYLLIDPAEHRLAKIDGTLSKEVGFGWGFLGHLDQGGHFLVKQGEVLKGDWEITQMSLSFTGKILLFKTLNIQSDEIFSHFRAAPPELSFAQGVELLNKEELDLAENRRQSGNEKSK
jgi:hypothetical protein